MMPKLPRTPKGWYSADVYWYCPGRKRPIAYSTMATSGIIKTAVKPLASAMGI